MADTITPNAPIAINASLNVDDVRVLARRASAGSTEAISDAANGVDQRIGLLVVKLAAHASDIDIDDVGRRIEMKIPDVLKQHGARYDAAFIAHQILQELEFAGQQLDFLAAPACGAVDQVDREIADSQDGFLGNDIAAPAKRLDARQELDERVRLDQIVVAAGTQASHPFVDLAERADDQEGSRIALHAQLAHDGDAVDIGKHAVDRDDRIVARRAQPQRLVAVGRQVHLVAAGRQLLHELAGGFRVVFDHQDAAVTFRHVLRL